MNEKFKVGETVYVSSFYFARDGKAVKACEVKRLTITSVMENYLTKYGLHYGASKTGNDDTAMAYKPERLFTSRDNAVTDLKRRISERIDILAEALSKAS